MTQTVLGNIMGLCYPMRSEVKNESSLCHNNKYPIIAFITWALRWGENIKKYKANCAFKKFIMIQGFYIKQLVKQQIDHTMLLICGKTILKI